MVNYSNFSTKDFATDDSFCRWVLQRDNESEIFWKNWIAQHPEKEQTLMQARKLVLSLQGTQEQRIEDVLINQTWEHITGKIHQQGPKVISLHWSRLAVAATLLLIGVVSVWLWINNDSSSFIASGPQWAEVSNTGSEIQNVVLEDGTTVTLEPNSYLSYPLAFEKEKRAIVLRGAAFFNVTRDTERPFLVFAQETCTKVLGTSFFIKAFETEENVEVTVRTGTVAVYAQKPSESKKSPADSERHLIVTPNQKVIFNRKSEDMVKMLAENPEPVLPKAKLPGLKFEEAPLSEIFQALEEVYKIEIVYDQMELEKCRLTTTLNDQQSMFEKLSIICDALGLAYREEEAQIIISGKGCK